VSVALVGFDPLRDKTYQSTRLGRDVADFLAWLELGGARPRTLDQYERRADSNRCMSTQCYVHVRWEDDEAREVHPQGSQAARCERGAALAVPRPRSLRVRPQELSGLAHGAHVARASSRYDACVNALAHLLQARFLRADSAGKCASKLRELWPSAVAGIPNWRRPPAALCRRDDVRGIV
jgi:hypothetical protein